MDPISALANFAAALLNYATEVRRDMKPELRDQLDGWVMNDISHLRKLMKLDSA